MPTGERLTYLTVHASVLLYAGSIALRAAGRAIAAARWLWTIGCLLLWVHVACAMHFIYRWDHARMVAQTARQTAEVTGVDFAGGVYFNYVFMIVWAADAASWWTLGDERYRRRPVWVTMIVHALMAFIVFNAVIVFARSASVRYAGIAACVAIAGCFLAGRRSRVVKGIS